MRNRVKDYYENNNERLRVQAGDKYRNLSKEQKIKKDNMEKIYVAVYLKRRKKKTKRISKKLSGG